MTYSRLESKGLRYVMKWWTFAGLLPFFISAGFALLCAFSFKAWEKSQRRRSPLAGRKVGNIPGQELVSRQGDHDAEILSAVLLMYLALPMAFMAWVGIRFRLDTVPWGWIEIVFLLLGVALFGFGLSSYIRHYLRREKVRDGLLAERVTGMQLNRLVASGCFVMHDLPGDGFNIDHVVIAPRGVYAIETKSFRKPKKTKSSDNYKVSFDGVALQFPDFIEKSAVAQAQRQAQWLSRILRESVGREVHVKAALALPGWHIEQSVDIWRNAPVKVFSPMGNGASFMTKDINAIDQVTRNLIRDVLAVRYPSVDS